MQSYSPVLDIDASFWVSGELQSKRLLELFSERPDALETCAKLRVKRRPSYRRHPLKPV